MTPEQAKLVADGCAQLEPRLDEFGAAVFDRLFTIAPETRALFTGDMAAQHKKLITTLMEFVQLRRRSQHFLPVTGQGGEAVVPGIERLRARHEQVGVKGEHFPLLRTAILHSLATMLGRDFDERAAEAWSAAFDILAEAIERPRSAAPQEVKFSNMLGRRFEDMNANADARSVTPDEFFDEK